MARNEERFRAAERQLWASVGALPNERRVRLPGGESVRIQDVGEGPPILFVHGASNGGASWAPLIAGLEGFRCLALDRPGCGLSDPVGGGAGFGDISDVESYADSLIADILDALDLPSAHVVATSFGGYFAFRGAAANPGRVESLVELSWMMGAPMGKLPLPMRLSAVPGMGAIMTRIPPTRGAVKMILRQIGLGRALDSGRFTDEMFEWFLALLRDTDTMANEQRANPRVVTPIRGHNPRMLLGADVIGRVSMPVLFVWGGEDPNGGAAVARVFSAEFSNASLEVLAEAGHAPWIDEPEITARLTQNFLGRTE